MADLDIPKAAMSFAYMALTSALSDQLKEAAKKHNGKPGDWLDRIEYDLVEGVKKGRSEGITDDEEFAAMRGAIALI